VLANFKSGAGGFLCPLFTLLNLRQCGLGHLLVSDDLVPLAWIRPLLLLREVLASDAQLNEFSSVSFRWLVSLPRTFQGFGHALSRALGHALGFG
jgi:hypothetical protein